MLQKKTIEELLKNKNITGIARTARGKDDIIIYIEPGTTPENIPESLPGEKIRTVQAKFYAYTYQLLRTMMPIYGIMMGTKHRTDRIRPVIAGISVSHILGTAGTITGFAEKNRKTLGITCNHVAALRYPGVGIGEKGDPIIQPGAYDGGTERDVIGYLYNWSRIGGDTLSDSASFELTEDYENRVLGYGVPLEKTRPYTGRTVVKSGRTTGRTTGKIEAVDAIIKMYYTETSYAIIREQIIVYSPTVFSMPGDSGSWVGTPTGLTIGMLIGGTLDGRRSVVTPIENIEKDLGVKMKLYRIAPGIARGLTILGLTALTVTMVK